MTDAAETAVQYGPKMVVRPGGGDNYWQPVPANGHISVRVAPHLVDLQTPFSLGTQTIPPGGYVREHAHPEHDEVLHFISGRGTAYVDGEPHPVEPGVTIFVGRNRLHKFVNDGGEQDLHWLWFIQPNGLEVFFRDIGRPKTEGGADPTPFPRPENVIEIEKRTAFAHPMPKPGA